MSDVAWFFTEYMTLGRWVILWVIGLLISVFSTAWIDGEGGLLGPLLYFAASVLLAAACGLVLVLTHLWMAAA